MNWRGALFLAVTAAAAGLVLVLLHQATQAVIQGHLRQAEEAALREVLPGAAAYRYRADLVGRGGGGKVRLVGVWEGVSGGAVYLLDSPGYGGPVRVMVGVREGRIAGVRVVAAPKETPGLGARVRESRFARAFLGLSDPITVEGIASATVSSRAVIQAAEKALALDRLFFRR